MWKHVCMGKMNPEAKRHTGQQKHGTTKYFYFLHSSRLYVRSMSYSSWQSLFHKREKRKKKLLQILKGQGKGTCTLNVIMEIILCCDTCSFCIYVLQSFTVLVEQFGKLPESLHQCCLTLYCSLQAFSLFQLSKHCLARSCCFAASARTLTFSLFLFLFYALQAT